MTAARLRYQTIEIGDIDVHLRTLRDNQQFSDPHGVAAALGISSASWPLFGVLWESGRVLAEVMLTQEIEGVSILEVGCGIGLASMVLNHRHADITATDRHPEAGAFLRHNVALNEGDEIPFVRTDWADADDTPLGRFGLVIGSDLLYEPEHVELLAGFLAQHTLPRCTIVLTDPGRAQRGAFRRAMAEQGFTFRAQPAPGDAKDGPIQVLVFER